MNEETVRLQKAIADAGVASRRHAEELIAAGQVTVNGEVVTAMGVKVSSRDEVQVNGMPLSKPVARHYLFYKPRGVITAVSDDKKRKVVTDYFQSVPERLYPVGRLDYDTSGLLIMTNDGEFANQLMHPRYQIEKHYVAKVQGIPSRLDLLPLKKGLKIDGKKVAPARYNILSSDKAKKTAIVELVIHQGLNHQVKKMFKAVGFPVIKLSRPQYGPITLDGLQPGEYRQMKPREVDALRKLARGEQI